MPRDISLVKKYKFNQKEYRFSQKRSLASKIYNFSQEK
jgi:hypothetical protein